MKNTVHRIINAIMMGATSVTFAILLIISEDSFSDSFLENFLAILGILIGSFFFGNIVIGIPIAIFYYLTTYTFEGFYTSSKKKRFFIVGLLLIVICAVIALFLT